MKQALSMSPAQREQYYLELAPTDAIILPDIAPTPLEISERKPLPAAEQKRVDMIRQEYQMQQAIQAREQSEISAKSGAVTLVKLGAIATGGALVWQIAAAFNPVALAVTAGVVGAVGLLTYPSKRREEAPTWMPRGGEPVAANKQATVNVNPVINVAVNVTQ